MCWGQDRQRCFEVQTEAAIGQSGAEAGAGAAAQGERRPSPGRGLLKPRLLHWLPGGWAARRSGADMAALVEPLGLERGKRARGPCPLGRGASWTPALALPSARARRGWAGRGVVSPAVSGCGRVRGRARGEGRRGPGDEGRPCHWRLCGHSMGTRCPSRLCPRWPLLGLWLHLSGLLCVLVSLTLSMRPPPPPPRRRVPGGGAPRAAPAQRGAAPAEAAGPPARPAEPLLLSHPRGERRAAPARSCRLQCSSWSPRGRGLRFPATPGAARLGDARASAPGFFGSCSFLRFQVWGGTVHGGGGELAGP